MASETLEGKVVNVEAVNEHLVSPHKAARCTVKFQQCETGTIQTRTTGKIGTSSKM